MSAKRNIIKSILRSPIWVFNYLFIGLPNVKESGKRWGITQSAASIAFFFIALYFPFAPKQGEPMTIGNYFAYVFLGIGGFFMFLTVFLSYRYFVKKSEENTATKDDIAKLESAINVNTAKTNLILMAIAQKLGVDTNALLKDLEKYKNGESEPNKR